jgi:chromate transporter
MKESPRLGELGGLFFRAGNFTLGAGAAATAVLQRELVFTQHWFDAEDFALCYALAQVTPGTNLLAFYSAIGWKLRGWRGALMTLGAGAVPCCFLVALITAGFDRISRNPGVAAGVEGALAASVGVLLASFWLLVRPYLKGRRWPRSVAVVGASFVLTLYAGLSPVTVLLLAGLSGLIGRARE